jgi:hypothetical protein
VVAGLDELRAQLRSSSSTRRCATVAALTLVIACGDSSVGKDRRTTPATPGEGGSPVSLDSALTLFRQDLEPVTELQDSETSIAGLVTRLRRAVEESDTNALRALVMSRREFAWLYYPTSAFTRPPTRQEPGLAWFLHLQASQKGVTRLLSQYGGQPLRIADNACKAPPRLEGNNTLWLDCVQHVVEEQSDTTVIRLFGGVLERNGRFKILSYSNDL